MAMRCEAWREELVDYVDGELPAERATAVTEHLRGCAACGRRVEALRQSLALAHSAWEASAQDTAAVSPVPPRLRTRRLLAWLAPGVAVAAGVLLAILAWQRPGPAERRAAPEDAGSAFEQEIERAGLGAQMLAVADLLAETPGGREVACERYRQIETEFPNSGAALTAAQRHERLCQGG